MNLSLPVTVYDDWPLLSLHHAVGVLQPLAMPLTAAELLTILRERWGASHDRSRIAAQDACICR